MYKLLGLSYSMVELISFLRPIMCEVSQVTNEKLFYKIVLGFANYLLINIGNFYHIFGWVYLL
jgi:hypothetical protein